MDSLALYNLFSLIFLVIWINKMRCHFLYLKSKNQKLKDYSFIEFMIQPKNFITVSFLMLPFFLWGKTRDNLIKKARIKAQISTILLWVWIIFFGYFSFNNPPEKQQKVKKYDFTKKELNN